MNSATWSAVTAICVSALPVSYGITQLVWGPIRRSHSGKSNQGYGPSSVNKCLSWDMNLRRSMN